MIQFDLVNMFGGEAVLEVSLLPHHAVPLHALHVGPDPLQDPAGQAGEVNQLPLLQVTEQVNRISGDLGQQILLKTST